MPEIDDIDQVKGPWADDAEALAALIASAQAFAARDEVVFDGPIREYFFALVEWLKFNAPHGLRLMSHQSPMAGCAADARRKIGAGKK